MLPDELVLLDADAVPDQLALCEAEVDIDAVALTLIVPDGVGCTVRVEVKVALAVVEELQELVGLTLVVPDLVADEECEELADRVAVTVALVLGEVVLDESSLCDRVLDSDSETLTLTD